MGSIIKGLAALMAPKWDPSAWSSAPLDLTRRNTGVTREERQALWAATGTIAGRVISLDAYRLSKNESRPCVNRGDSRNNHAGEPTTPSL